MLAKRSDALQGESTLSLMETISLLFMTRTELQQLPEISCRLQPVMLLSTSTWTPSRTATRSISPICMPSSSISPSQPTMASPSQPLHLPLLPQACSEYDLRCLIANCLITIYERERNLYQNCSLNFPSNRVPSHFKLLACLAK